MKYLVLIIQVINFWGPIYLKTCSPLYTKQHSSRYYGNIQLRDGRLNSLGPSFGHKARCLEFLVVCCLTLIWCEPTLHFLGQNIGKMPRLVPHQLCGPSYNRFDLAAESSSAGIREGTFLPSHTPHHHPHSSHAFGTRK